MSQMIDFTVPSTVPGRTLHAFRCVPDGQVRAIQAHAGAQLLGQDDTAKCVNTTDDSSCFHKSYSPFTFYTDERVPNDGVPCRTGPQCPG